jgi:hypothetical protein
MWSDSLKWGMVMVLLTIVSVSAHDSLYHYIEISSPRNREGAEIAFSIHAADLESARAVGADPAGTDLAWLQNRTAAEMAPLLLEARAFLANHFTLQNYGEPISLDDALAFPKEGSLAAGDEAARPGFLVGILRLPPGAVEVELLHAPTSGKRLMVVVSRPGAFPEVRDLAPGEKTTISLSKP